MDRFKPVLLVAGLGCFFLAFVLSGLYPWFITDFRKDEASIEEVARDVTPDFRALKDAYPVVFDRAFKQAKDAKTERELIGVAAEDESRQASEKAWQAAHADALRQGRDHYIADACWHCHSQYVRPVANESVRFGEVLKPEHDNNALQRPVLWGTRRVGPDLTHEGGLRSNDWHVAHLWKPRSTSPGSVMPRYPWFFDEGWYVVRTVSPEVADREGIDAKRAYRYPGMHATKEAAEAALEAIRKKIPSTLEEERDRLRVERGRGPNERGLALVAYLQWLGTWDPYKSNGER